MNYSFRDLKQPVLISANYFGGLFFPKYIHLAFIENC